jgi:DNA-directed RNA polymerase subunit RPC12/RpoP
LQQQCGAAPLALLQNRNNVLSDDTNKRMIHIQPLPMPAVAHCDFDIYDDIDGYEYGDDDDEFAAHHQASCHLDILAGAAAGGGGSGRGPTIIGGNNDNTTSRFIGGPPSGGSGGGGHSHHRCPKCGATVTFQDTSKTNKGMQNNCFYCAACSGWFLVKPNHTNNSSTVEMDESKFLLSKMAATTAAAEGSGEKVVGAPPNRKISQPQFVLQHVSGCVVELCLSKSYTLTTKNFMSHFVSYCLVVSYLVFLSRCRNNHPTHPPETPPMEPQE